jgi:hypothetical protein
MTCPECQFKDVEIADLKHELSEVPGLVDDAAIKLLEKAADAICCSACAKSIRDTLINPLKEKTE